MSGGQGISSLPSSLDNNNNHWLNRVCDFRKSETTSGAFVSFAKLVFHITTKEAFVFCFWRKINQSIEKLFPWKKFLSLSVSPSLWFGDDGIVEEENMKKQSLLYIYLSHLSLRTQRNGQSMKK